VLAAVFIFFSSFSYLLIQYDRLRTADMENWARIILAGSLPAPVQYRIGLPLLTHFLELHTHLRVNQSLPLIESLSYALALTLLYLLFRGSLRVQQVSRSHRFVILGLFFAAAQFPVLWIFPWEREETLPTAFYLAAIVLLIVRRGRMPFALACLLTVLLSFAQALLRADVPFMAGIAILICAAMAVPFSRPRAHIATLGLLCTATGAAVQLYLQRIAYPTATYPPNTPKIQLLNNLNPIYPPLHMPEFLTALLPFIVSLVLLRRYRLALDSSDKLVLLLCLVYLPVWIATGLIAEVRIFVPYLFLASPTIAKLWASYLLKEDTIASSQPSA
jgi:hypothetical protein